jgi:opacity protein-like surface antigen
MARLILAVMAVLALAAPAAQAADAPKIEVLSNRADLISAGDALVAMGGRTGSRGGRWTTSACSTAWRR